MTPRDAGKYHVIATNEAGKVESIAKLAVVSKPDIRRNKKPSFTSQLSDQQLKEGETIQLTAKATENPELKWKHNGILIKPDGNRIKITKNPDGSETLEIKDIELSDSGEYSVVATNDNGSATSNAFITIQPDKRKRGTQPVILKSLEDTKAEIGSLVKLIVKVNGNPEPKIKWFHNDELILPQAGYVRMSEYPDGTNTLVLNDVQPEKHGEYKLIATNEFGTAATKAILTVSSKPDIIKGLKDTEIEEGSPIQFEIKFDGFPVPDLKWLHDSKEIIPDGESIKISQLPDGTGILTIENAKLTDCGDYQVIATNVAGKVSSRAHLSVKPKPEEVKGEAPVFIVPLEDIKTFVGNQVKFEIEVVGKPQPTLKWYQNGKVVVPQRGVIRTIENPDGTATLLINSANTNDSAEYRVVATNKFGKNESKAVLTVVSKPTIIADLKDVEIEEGSPLKLEIKFDGTPTPQIKWSHNGEEINPNDERIALTIDDGIATLTILDSAISDGGEYRAIISNECGSAVSNAVISVSAKDSDTSNKPAFITGLYNRSVSINEPIKLDVKVSGLPKPTLKWLHNGERIEEIPNEISLIENDDGTCILSISNLSANDAGEYRVIATNELGTSTSNAILTVLSKPEIIDGLEDLEINEGSPIKLKIRIKAYPQPDVKWYYNGEEIIPDKRFIKSSQNSNGECTLEILKASISDSGEYSVEAKNEIGEAESHALVSVRTKSNIILQHGEKPEFEEGLEDSEIDLGSTIELDVVVTGEPQPILKWLHNGKEILPEKNHIRISQKPDGSASIVISDATFDDAGNYRVIATNESGTIASDCVLSVLSKPIFVTSLKDQYLIEGETAKFKVKINASPKPEIKWLLNDNEIHPNGNDVKVAQEPDGTYTLTIENVSPNDIGKYSVVALNQFGSATSAANLSVSPKLVDSKLRGEKPTFAKELNDLQIEDGFPAKFEIKVCGNPLPELKWYRNDIEIAPSSGVIRISQNPDGNAYLLLHEANVKDEGSYKVIATNEHGTAECGCQLSVSIESKPDYSKLSTLNTDDDTIQGISKQTLISYQISRNCFLIFIFLKKRLFFNHLHTHIH